ncbi:hypothetical protein RMQ97_02060 [Maricaulis sp. D1M11]|uniref:hypothetical protein n=1 Tax=Maricaulis sp. D1M11 TaxID=3076117 RepID=UPI0039B53A91
MADVNSYPEPQAHLGVGAILSETFGLFGRNFVFFFSLGALPSIVWGMINIGVERAQRSAIIETDAFPSTLVYTSFVIGLVALIGYLVLQGVMARSAIALKTGNGTQLSQAVMSSLSGLFPIMILGLAAGVMIVLGFLALIIPALYVAAMVSVFVPAIVFEKRGFGALGRSFELTRGYRWAIAGVMIVINLIGTVISGVLGAIVALVVVGGVYGNDPTTLVMQDVVLGHQLLGVGIEALINGITLPLSMISTALIFVRLREIKEGGDAEDLVRVFE